MQHFWNIISAQEINVVCHAKPGSALRKEQEEYVEKLTKLSYEVRDGIITKWLTYSKSENLTNF